MADSADPRPLSPHMGVWRWHITMAASIFHRGAGIVLYLAVIGIVTWLAALAMGPDAYDALIGWTPRWLVHAAAYAVAAVLGFHLANGVRHLAWDSGAGFKPQTANLTAWIALLCALAAPAGLWFLLPHS